MKKELAIRESNGLTVTLYWHSGTNRVSVRITPSRPRTIMELVGSASSPNVFDATKNIQCSVPAGIAIADPHNTRIGPAYPSLRSAAFLCYGDSAGTF